MTLSSKIRARLARLPQTIRIRLYMLTRYKELPLNEDWGFSRGVPIDRYYIEKFLSENGNCISGHVLSVGDDSYARKFNSTDIVSDILHINEVPGATIVGDLTNAPHIPDEQFDCFLFIQTLQLIYDFRAALQTIYRIMKPGGAVLATFPGITPLKDEEWNESWYWNYTYQSARRLFCEFFPESNLTITVNGNALAATAFVDGLATKDLPRHALDRKDPRFPLIITVKAVKPGTKMQDSVG